MKCVQLRLWRAVSRRKNSLTIGAELDSTGQGRFVVACRGASLPRKKDAHFITANSQYALAA